MSTSVPDNMLQIFSFEGRYSIEVLGDFDNPWFSGKDVATALGYKDTVKALRDHVDEEDKSRLKDVLKKRQGESPCLGNNALAEPIDEKNDSDREDAALDESKNSPPTSSGRISQKIFINESGLYSLILRSKLESAKTFKRWVTYEVLPSIRKKGSFIVEEKNAIIASLQEQIQCSNQETQEAKQARQELHEEQKDKVRIIKNHNSLLKKRQYHKFKQGPCFYIWHNPATPTVFKIGYTKDISERLKQERSSVPDLYLDYLVYLAKAKLLEECMLDRYENQLTEPNHEMIQTTIEALLKSVTHMLKLFRREHTIEQELWKYNNEPPPVPEEENKDPDEDENKEEKEEQENKEEKEAVVPQQVLQPIECPQVVNITNNNVHNTNNYISSGYPKKQCDECKKIKLLDKFWVRKTSKDGRDNRCMKCRNNRRKELQRNKGHRG